jgi:hypothetical protein
MPDARLWRGLQPQKAMSCDGGVMSEERHLCEDWRPRTGNQLTSDVYVKMGQIHIGPVHATRRLSPQGAGLSICHREA